MPILFQIDEIEPPVQVELKKKRGRPKKSGGATDTQRGQAARFRTHVRIYPNTSVCLKTYLL